MPVTTKTLQLIFASDSKERRISIKDPIPTLTAVQIDSAMEAVIIAGVFRDAMGNPLTQAISAEVIDKSTTDYEVEYPNA